ncbi:MAG: hypothetical protein JGK08_27115 [Microcoleus sp. PH2017_04_SCI_O_A]|nr:hypothetical protein [Microcoleus sp. PH2017_04_SCI_O_A]
MPTNAIYKFDRPNVRSTTIASELARWFHLPTAHSQTQLYGRQRALSGGVH